MAIENPGITRLRSSKVYLAASANVDVAVSGNAAIARHRDCEEPLSDFAVQSVRAHLERVLHSKHFDGSARSREFLRFVVEEVLAGRAAYLKQAAIAVEVFGRKADFDAVIDPIVRVQAGRLRRSLERYYLLSGDVDSIRIELPKGSYAPVFVQAADQEQKDQPESSIETACDWPTVVVYPFAVQSAGNEQSAAQLRDELTAELGRYGILRVVLPAIGNSSAPRPCDSARFELHGIARAAGGSAMFSGRLVDRGTGQQIWADEFNSPPHLQGGSETSHDIGRVIAARIGAEHGVVARLLAGESTTRGFSAPDGFGAIARCQYFHFSRQISALQPAIESLQNLTRRAPEIELAWTSLARLYLMNYTLELSSLFTPLDMAIGCANQGVLLEPANARARCLMAMALLVKGELGAARHELELALRHSGDSLAYREMIGWLMGLCGDWDAGVAMMRSAMERNPYCQPCASHGLWADAMRRGDFESAYASALEYRESNVFWRELMITSALGQLGRIEDARASAAELLRAKAQFVLRGRRLIGHYIKSDDLRATIIQGLNQAGIDLA